MLDDDWLDPTEVAEWMQLDTQDGAVQDARVEQARAAAAAYVRRVRPDLFVAEPVVVDNPGPAAVLAGMIATKRLYARTGGSGFAEFGPAVALLELDPDVSALLELGAHAPPRVG